MVTPDELDLLSDIDIDVADPDDYADSSAPNLIPEGHYNFYITDFDVTRDYESKQPDGKGFVLTIEVADGELEGRTLRNMKVWTSTYLRKGVKVSSLGDLIRAIDSTARWSGAEGARLVLQKAVDTKQKFRARVIWTAFDSDHFAALGGPAMENKSKAQKEARRAATVKYMRNFKLMPDGSYYPETTGPSGAVIEAKVEFDTFTPSYKRRD